MFIILNRSTFHYIFRSFWGKKEKRNILIINIVTHINIQILKKADFLNAILIWYRKLLHQQWLYCKWNLRQQILSSILNLSEMNPLYLKLNKLKNFEFKAEYLLSYEVISFSQSDQGVVWFSLHNNKKLFHFLTANY